MISIASCSTTLSLIFLCLFTLVPVCKSYQDLSLNDGSEDICRPWFVYDTTRNECVCSDKGNGHVKCTENGALLRFGSCMTYEKENKTVVGRCQYFVLYAAELNVSEQRYFELPDNLADLNDYVCGPMNRRGLICSECIDGFGPSLTSIGYHCTDCNDAWYGIPLFLFLEFVPVTILYLIIFFFRISLTSAPMTSFILYSQLSVYAASRVDSEARSIMQFVSPTGYRSLISLATFYSIWNLDFFRYVLPPLCISANLNIIHVEVLGYLSAFYPLFLIAVTYLCTKFSEMYKCKCTSFLKVKVKSKRVFNIKNSIVDVFASFFLLSYTKLMLIFTSCLGFTRIVNVDGTILSTRLGIDPSLVYFVSGHIAYFLFGMVLLIGPLLLSALLLTLYPIKAVRSILLKCHCGGHSKAALNIFVTTFHNCYKDGLDGGRDMRSLSGYYFLVRALILVIAALVPPYNYGTVTWISVSILFGVSSLLVAIVRPYKKTYMSVFDALILLNMSVGSAIFSLLFVSIRSPEILPFSTEFILFAITFFGCIPMVGLAVYLTVIFIVWSKKVSFWLKIKNFCCTWKKVGEAEHNGSAHQNATVSDHELPDRFLHPEEYVGDGGSSLDSA